MNENQEKEIVGLLGTLISEVREIRKTQNEHSTILETHSTILEKHSSILDQHSEILHKHSKILDEHSKKFDLLINRTDDIANTVMKNDKRLSAVEKDVAEIRGGIH